MQTIKDQIKEQAAKGDSSEIWETFRAALGGIASNIASGRWNSQQIEERIHFLWYILIQGIKNLSPEALGQYHMLYTVLYIRELGNISQHQEDGGGIVKIRGKKLWTELPCLFEDLEEAASRDSDMVDTQHINIIAFLAKLLAAGVCESDLAKLARQSFETAITEQPSPQRIKSLKTLLIWLTYASDKITQLSSDSIQGMSPSTWQSWQKCFAEFTAGEEADVALLGMEAYLKMYESVWRTQSPMRPEGIELDHQQEHIVFLGAFCDRYPEMAKPGWKKLVGDLKCN